MVPDLEYCDTKEDCARILGGTGVDVSSYSCSSVRHVCMQVGVTDCLQDKDCNSARQPRCDTKTNKCTECVVGDTSDTSCKHFADTPMCAPNPSGSGTMCVACATNLDCKKEAPICDKTTGACRTCREHRDCEGKLVCDGGSVCEDSMVCMRGEDYGAELAGRCAQNGSFGSTAGRVVYVHKQDPTCDNTDPPVITGSTFDKPLCRINQALVSIQSGLNAGKRYIRVLGKDYEPLEKMINSGQFIFIGAPGKNYTGPAVIDNIRSTAFNINSPANVTLDQFDMLQSAFNYSLISCINSNPNEPATVRIYRSILRGSYSANDTGTTNAAVQLSVCNAVIDGNIIGAPDYASANPTDISAQPAFIHGISINHQLPSSTKYQITNNVIAGNVTSGLFLSLDTIVMSNTVLNVAFNTIYHNGRARNGYGVICSTGSSFSKVRLSNNIIYENGNGTSSQFMAASACSFNNVLVGSREKDMSLQGAIYKDVLFDGKDGKFVPADNAANRDSCIDKAMLGNDETLPAFDVYGTPRPQPAGGRGDIGAAEVMTPAG